MAHHRWLHRFRLALVCALVAAPWPPARATDLVDAWRAAQQHDLDDIAGRAAWQAGASRRDQAHALWRPSVMLSGTAGVAGSDTHAAGAQFSASGLGTSSGVGFDTSIKRGTLGRVGLSASLPLYDRERDAQGRQLELSADVADREWAGAQQTLILDTAQRYLDVVSAQEALRVLRQQRQAVAKALAETQDRFRLGDVPITDTQEAAARFEAIAAQVLALETDLRLRQEAFMDATGLKPACLSLMIPVAVDAPAALAAMADWLQDAQGPQGHTPSICTIDRAEQAWANDQHLLADPGPASIGARCKGRLKPICGLPNGQGGDECSKFEQLYPLGRWQCPRALNAL